MKESMLLDLAVGRNLQPYSRVAPHLDDYDDVVADLRCLSQICDKGLDRTFICLYY